ncbi:MAG: Cytochrome [Francisellaceae bacterium]|nr:Cytochrome [Francisellaceae bacterium]
MQYINTTERYGVISKTLHWAIAILFIFEFLLIYSIMFILKNHDYKMFLFQALHKPIGFILLVLGFLAVLWRIFSHKPGWPLNMRSWEQILARVTHTLLYCSMVIMPLSGLIGNLAAGYTVELFGLYTISPASFKDEFISKVWFNIHGVTSYCILVIVFLHIIGALKHHFIDKNNILKRMMPFGS